MREWTAADEARVLAMHRENVSLSEIAAALGRDKNAVRQKRDRLLRGTVEAKRAPESPDDQPREIESAPSVRIVTLDQLLATCSVDLDVWEVERYVVNKWEVGAKGPDDLIVVEPLYQVKAWLRRKVTQSMQDFRDAMLVDISADTSHRPRFRLKAGALADSAERYMMEVDIADLHVGKLAWGEETGTDYDSAIAEKLARDAVTELLWNAERYPIEKFTLPVGNDLLHYEFNGLTTAGTPQDRDTRWLKMFRRARGVTSWMITTLAERAPVEVVIVPGNHARMGEMAIGEVLAAEFASDSRVTFNRSPAPRKYVVYGKNLIGFAHGDGEPHDKFPQLMAVEEKQRWADTTHREFHIGHIHKQKKTEPVTVDDKLGVTVRILRSLSGVDAWHASKGYLGTRGAEAFVYRQSGGLVAHYMTYVPQAA